MRGKKFWLTISLLAALLVIFACVVEYNKNSFAAISGRAKTGGAETRLTAIARLEEFGVRSADVLIELAYDETRLGHEPMGAEPIIGEYALDVLLKLQNGIGAGFEFHAADGSTYREAWRKYRDKEVALMREWLKEKNKDY